MERELTDEEIALIVRRALEAADAWENARKEADKIVENNPLPSDQG
jgi:hypothetical protein|tara:strand:+ start:573 stop:710 length:138 start_codon:yes stop_codon:yes gene_type:complete